MQRPSYPKETADQWPPIAGDHTGWGGACNQSINTGRSLGEQYNLMRHTPTHTSPLIWFPPPPGLHPPPETFSSFLTLFISVEPQFQPNSPALLRCSTLLPPSSTFSTPNDISEIPRGQDTQKEEMLPCWSWRGQRWRQSGRLMGSGEWAGQIIDQNQVVLTIVWHGF